MRKFAPLLAIIVALLSPRLALAWDDPGHLTIAAEAYRQLSPEVKAQVFEILKSHPDFNKWKQAYHPNPVLDFPATAFMRCAAWPDEIRGSDSPYDHPYWHFIDYPLRPPSFDFEPDALPTNNILFGITQCETTLAEPTANPRLRAVYLSYLVHLVGDIHQPLHCASFYSDVYTNGDRGGNEFFVKSGDYSLRLHALWDGLLGTMVNLRGQWNDGTRILAKFPRSALPQLMQNTNPVDWSLESRTLAIKYGYLNGSLQGGVDPDTAIALPDDYTNAAGTVAERQAALAGYRLADEIQKYVKWNKALPNLPANTSSVDTETFTRISPNDASHNYDETLIVTGKVATVRVTPSTVLIRLEQPADATEFTAVIFKEYTSQFSDLQKLAGQNVEISGTITEYRKRPEIIIQSTNQVKVLGP